MNRSKQSWWLNCRQTIESILFNNFVKWNNRYTFNDISLKCGKLLRHLGIYFFKTNKIGYYNLQQAFPSLSKLQRQTILTDMWFHLGCFLGEFLQIYTNVTNEEIVKICTLSEQSQRNLQLIQTLCHQSGALIASAHYGNWEIGMRFLQLHHLPLNCIYRPLNNSYIEAKTAEMRRKCGINLLPKGSHGVRQIIQLLQKKELIMGIMDQHLTNGIQVPFFHKLAKTADAFAKLAVDFHIPIFPAYVKRQITNNKVSFELKFCDPIYPQIQRTATTIQRQQENLRIMTEFNHTLEDMIIDTPEQWFWLHNRWKIKI